MSARRYRSTPAGGSVKVMGEPSEGQFMAMADAAGSDGGGVLSVAESMVWNGRGGVFSVKRVRSAGPVSPATQRST